MRQGQDGHYVVSRLSVLHPHTVEEVQSMLMEANKRRRQSPTDANQESSRSHAVFQITVTKKPKASGVTAIVLEGKLNLIDLAGSERASKTNNRSERMREGANINTSLLALGRCINALGENYRSGKYIPFRDSKLTRLLKDSLGGNCRTTMIAAISPSSLSFEDTYNTLSYANRTRNIKINATRKAIPVHTNIGQLRDKVEQLNAQIIELRARLKDAESKQGSCSCIKTQPAEIQQYVSRAQQLYSVQTKIFTQLVGVDARITTFLARVGDGDDDDDEDGNMTTAKSKGQQPLNEARDERDKLVAELGYNEKALSLVFADIEKLPENVKEIVSHEVNAVAHEAHVAQCCYAERCNTAAVRLLTDISAASLIPVNHPLASRIRSFLSYYNRTSGIVFANIGRAPTDVSPSTFSSTFTRPALSTATTSTTSYSQISSPAGGLNLKRSAVEADLPSADNSSKRVARFGGDESRSTNVSAVPVRLAPASFLRPGVSIAPNPEEEPFRAFTSGIGQRTASSADAAAFMPTEQDNARKMPLGILKKSSSARLGDSSRSVSFSSDVKTNSDSPRPGNSSSVSFISASPMPHPTSSEGSTTTSSGNSFGLIARRLNAVRVPRTTQSFEVPPFRRQTFTSANRSTTVNDSTTSSTSTTAVRLPVSTSTTATTTTTTTSASSSRTASMFQPLSSTIGQSLSQQ